MTKTVARHNLIAKTAKEMAAEWYESAAHDNAFYRAFPSRRNFVRAMWSAFAPQARAILASMLAGDYPQSMKDEIYEALQLDWTFAAPDGPRQQIALH